MTMEPVTDDNKLNLINNTIELNGELYYTVRTFAELTDRTESAIRLLIFKGNRLAKLNAIKVGPTLLIPAKLYTEFPFCYPGRSKCVTFYNCHGKSYDEHIA